MSDPKNPYGRSGKLGPSTFELMMEDINKLLKNKSGGGSGGNGSGPELPQFSGGGIIKVIILIIVGFGVFTSFHTIQPQEEGVVTQLGKYVRTTQPGLNFNLPYGIEKVRRVESKTVHKMEFGFRTLKARSTRSSFNKRNYLHESMMLTGDLNIANVTWVTHYRISNPQKYLFNVRDAERNIGDISQVAVRRVVGDRLVGDVMTTGRVEISDEAKKLCQQLVDKYDMGIKIQSIVLQDVNPPEPVKDAFNEVNGAKQEQEQIINNAEREYNKVIPLARGEAEKLVKDAEAFALAAINRANGDASNFRSISKEFKKAPVITRRRMYLETMENILTNVEGFTVLDSELKGLLPLYGSQLSLKGGAK